MNPYINSLDSRKLIHSLVGINIGIHATGSLAYLYIRPTSPRVQTGSKFNSFLNFLTRNFALVIIFSFV